MARAKKGRGRVARREEEDVDSEEDRQTLKRSGKATFNRDETFDNSEDECIPPLLPRKAKN